MLNLKEIYDILVDHFVSDQGVEWVEAKILSTMLHLKVVSWAFENMDFRERNNQVDSLIQLPAPYTKGFWNLVTPDEAEALGLERVEEEIAERIHSWSDLVDYCNNQKEIKAVEPDLLEGRTEVISFYSYKGGVGRTTALAHVAYLLAVTGKKVVIVDLDIEAPSFLNFFSREMYDEPKTGLVDYFYDRITNADVMPNEVLVTDILTELKEPNIKGRLFMVPAGKMSMDYIEKADFIKARLVSGYQKDYWAEFITGLKEHVTPDYILIDTRTGINEWGAFSLLVASDRSFFFVYPNEENYTGIITILQAMCDVGYKGNTVVFSKVPTLQKVQDDMAKYWKKILHSINHGAAKDFLEPLCIAYSTELILANGKLNVSKDLFLPIAELIIFQS